VSGAKMRVRRAQRVDLHAKPNLRTPHAFRSGYKDASGADASLLSKPTKSSLHNGEGTRSQMTKHVGICCQAGRGVDGCEFALGRSGRVVGARRAVVAA
jgi:hypothetical protein